MWLGQEALLAGLHAVAAQFAATWQARPARAHPQAVAGDHGTWSADFRADALGSERRFRTFNVNDDFNRESMRIEIDTRLPSTRVILTLHELIEVRGAPRRLRLDNGPEFISAALRAWAERHGIELLHTQPGKPTQNAYIERFTRT